MATGYVSEPQVYKNHWQQFYRHSGWVKIEDNFQQYQIPAYKSLTTRVVAFTEWNCILIMETNRWTGFRDYGCKVISI